MANPQAQFSPPPFSPNPTSPGYSASFPPTKRPRLSPGAQSPYASPQMANGQLPNSGFPPQNIANGYDGAFQTETPTTPSAGAMGPPSRPVEEKAPGVDDLADVLYGSGIDVREEEAALQRGNYRAQGASFSTHQSFGSMLDSSQPFSDSQTYSYYSQNVPGDRGSFYGAGAFNQSPISPDAFLQQAEEAKKARIRRTQSQKQYEMQDPFLNGRLVWTKLEKEADSQRLGMPAQSMPSTQQWSRDGVAIGPRDGTRIASIHDRLVIPSDGVVADAITLLSLAAKERVRTLVEDSGSIARGRRATSHGVVPPELKDITQGLGKVTQATANKENPLKRSFSESNALPSPVSDDQAPLSTIAYPHLTARFITKRRNSWKAWEDKRMEKRSKRSASGILAGEPSQPGSVAGTPGPSTPGEKGLEPPQKMTKKEQKRQADLRASEALQRENTSHAVNMALGSSVKFGKKKISWMTSKTDAGVIPRKPAPAAAPAAASAAKETPTRGAGPSEFREDKEDGSNIQLRDLVHVLEPDLREKRALARAYNKLGISSRRKR